MINRILFTTLFLFALTSCYRVPEKIEPQVSFSVQEQYIKQLPSPFPELTSEEKLQPWATEYLIAQRFADELDLYRAVTSFKRAEYLLPPAERERLVQIQYQILLSYYLGKRYDSVVETFQRSELQKTNSSFTAYHDMLVMLYESYSQVDDDKKADQVLRAMSHYYPETAMKLRLGTALQEGDLETLSTEAEKGSHETEIRDLLESYDAKKKSVSKAQTLNLLPGAGYLYVGQKQSALTAFLLNGLFIAASVHFFNKGHIAAGIITTSFEMGWYFGGIYGAGEAAKLYNERLYETKAYPIMNQNGLFPVLSLRYGF